MLSEKIVVFFSVIILAAVMYRFDYHFLRAGSPELFRMFVVAVCDDGLP